jgi:hypothetical protein
MNNNFNIYKLPKNNNIDNFIKSDNLVLTTPFENHPLFSLGYHHFINRTRDAMSITQKLETKNEFYYVVNEYEPVISNYEDNLENLAKVYIKQDVKSREFYKFWEMCFLFDIIDNDSMEILILKDNGEAQAIDSYRNKFLSKKKYNIYKGLKKDIDADLIIATESKPTENEYIEYLLEELKNIIHLQNKKGHLVLKVQDTFTMPTIKLIYLLSSFYEETYIYKPFFSRISDSEKYIICKNFSGKETKKIISNLDTITKEIKSKNFINDVFIDIDVPNEFIDVFKFSNIKLVNQQQILINEIVKYIKENNYFGDKYHEYRNKQIESTKWWMSMFFPPSNNLFNNNKDNLGKILKSTINKNELEKNKFIEQII